MARQPMTPDSRRRYWGATSSLMWTVLALWAALGLILPLLAEPLNRVSLLGIPLGYYAAAQGSLIGFAVVIFWFTRRQDRIDETFHVAED
jgi:putative solute:sodium symporter small subunit